MSQISSHSDSYEYQSGKIKAGRYRRRTSSGEKFIVGKDAVKEIRRRSLDQDQDPITTNNQKRASVDKDGRRYSLEDKPNENNQHRRSSWEKDGRDRDRKRSIEKDRINENESVANDNLNDNNDPYGNKSVSKYQGSEFGPKKPLPKKFITEKEVEKEYKRGHPNELEPEHHHHHHDHRRHSHQDRNRDRERERRRSSGERDRELLLDKKVADKYDTGAGGGAGGKAHHHHHHHHREYHHRNYKKLLFPWPFANPKPSVPATCKVNKVDVAASAKSLKEKEVIKIVEVVKPAPEKEFILNDHTTSVSRSFQPPLVRRMEVNDDELEAIEKKARKESLGSDIRNDDFVATDYVKEDDCPFCGQGKFKLKFTWTGIMAAILLFPCGIYCCFKCRVQVCTYCGVSPM